MKHAIYLLLGVFAVGFLVPAAAAQSKLDARYYPNTTSFQPGQSVEVGTVQVFSNNTSAVNVTTQLEYPFNSTISPSNVSQITENQSQNFSIQVTPPSTFPQGSLTRTFNVQSVNHTVSQEITVNITERGNWTTPVQNVTRNVSVGSQGTFKDILLRQAGNKPETMVSANLSGNISMFLSYPSELTVYRENPQSLSLTYNVLKDQGFGYYNGTLELTGGNQTALIPVEAQLYDNITPEIGLAQIPDIPATKSEMFKVKASDNLAVSNVTGTVYRRKVVNQTVERVRVSSFTFSDEGNGVYEHRFDKTQMTGDYEIVIEAADTSGNTINTTERFRVKQLNGVHVTNDNFGVGHVIQGQTGSKTFLKLNQSTPVTVTLHSITPSNASVDIGIKKHGEPTPRYFKGIGESQEIEETGRYEVVVRAGESNVTPQDINAQLNFDTVEQQPTPNPVFFSARLIGGYGRPINDSYAGMDVQLYYENFRNGVPQTKVLHAEASADDCRNTTTMRGCIEDLSMGKVKDLTSRVDSLKWWNSIFKFIIFAETSLFLVFIVVLRITRKYRGVLKTQGRIDLASVMGYYGEDGEETGEDTDSGGAK